VNNEFCIQIIRQFLEDHKFQEAACWTNKLGLQHHFDVTEIVLPLLVNCETLALENYVRGIPELQEKLVLYLDHLCDKKTDLVSLKQSILIDGVTKKDKFGIGYLKKLAIKLLKLYDIPQGKYSFNVGRIIFFCDKLRYKIAEDSFDAFRIDIG
jgi:hypothetical protein